MSPLDELNTRFALDGALRFDEGQGGLTRVRVATKAATAEIYLQGAHVALWQPVGAMHPGLFLSEKSQFAVGKAIRGGVPIVFPWFADRGQGLPGSAHGFARTELWSVTGTEQRPEGVAITFELRPDEGSRGLGYDHFVITYRVVVGKSLSLTMTVDNAGEGPLRIEEALHAYFAVGEIRQVAVTGLVGTEYLDRGDGTRRKRQEAEAIRFEGETDQLHLNTEAAITIADSAWQRRIVIEKQGSASTVVWNPWLAKATRLADLGAEAWPGMVCVEPANAAENAVEIAAGASYSMGATVRIEPF